MKTPLNSKRLRYHFSYSWWKYTLIGVLIVGAWLLIFDVTRHRAPEDKKLDVYLYGSGDQIEAQAWMDQIRETKMADMEEINAIYMIADETYGLQALSVRIGAGEGDLFVLPREDFMRYLSLYVPLEEDPEIQEICEAAGIDIATCPGWRTNVELGERHLYGLPINGMEPLQSWLYAGNQTYYIAIRRLCGNDENAMKLFKIILREMLLEKPASATITDLSPAEAIQ